MTSCHATHHLCLCDKVVCVSTCFIARLQSKTHNRETIKVPFLLTRLELHESFFHSLRGRLVLETKLSQRLLSVGSQALSVFVQHWKLGSLRDCSALGAKLSQILLSVGSQALSVVVQETRLSPRLLSIGSQALSEIAQRWEPGSLSSCSGNQALSEIAQRWEPGSLSSCSVLGARLSQ